MRTVVIILVLLLLAGGALRAGNAEANSSILRPPDTPTVVSVGFYLSDINDVNEQQETFEFEAQLISSWKDPRQAFDPSIEGTQEKTYSGDFQFNEVFSGWWPQLILANESGNFDRQGVLLRIQPDGQLTLIQEINATAEMPMNLHRFPFDRQTFEARFLVLGYPESEILLQTDLASTGRDDDGVQIAQWDLKGLDLRTDTLRPHLEQNPDVAYSRLIVELDMKRRPQFMLRIVVFPLTLLCLLCASVFWMDHESLGDRMSISFTGLLTVVAYQFLVGGSLPTIAYLTLMDGFLFSTYLFVAASIAINLRVDHLNRTGRQKIGDDLDEKCRWIFPISFVTINAILTALAFSLG